MGVSVVLLTYNGERAAARVLESVTWADELVALDGGSTDTTRRSWPRTRRSFTPSRWISSAHMAATSMSHAMLASRSPPRLDPGDRRRRSRAGPRCARRSRRRYGPTSASPTSSAHESLLGRPARLLVPTTSCDSSQGLCPLRGPVPRRPPGGQLSGGAAYTPTEALSGRVDRALLAKLHTRTSQRARVALADPAAIDTSASRIFYYTFRYYYREQGAAADGLLVCCCPRSMRRTRR